MKHELSIWSAAKIMLLLAGFWALYQVRDIVVIVLIAGVLATTLEPYVERLAKLGVRRTLGVPALVLLFLTALGVLGYLFVPPLVAQVREIAGEIPRYADKWQALESGAASGTVRELVGQLSDRLTASAGNLFGILLSLFGGIFSAVTILVLTAYFLLEGNLLITPLMRVVPAEHRAKAAGTVRRIREKLGDWFSGQLLLMLIIGLVDGLALYVLGIRFAVALGLLAGLLEIIPVLGPIFAGCAAVLVALATDATLWKVIAIVAVYVAVQQVENQVLVPKIMQKAIGLSPVVVIVAILVGGKLMGVAGAALAIPVTAAIQVALKEWVFPD